MDEPNVTLVELKQILREFVTTHTESRLDRMDEAYTALDNKLDIVVSNITAFEKKILSELGEASWKSKEEMLLNGKQRELCQRENLHQHEAFLKALSEITSRIGALNNTVNNHGTRIAELEGALKILTKQTTENHETLTKDLEKINDMFDKDEIAFLKNLKKKYEAHKNFQKSLWIAAMAIATLFGTIVYFQDILLKLEEIKTKAKKPTIEETKKKEEKKPVP